MYVPIYLSIYLSIFICIHAPVQSAQARSARTLSLPRPYCDRTGALPFLYGYHTVTMLHPTATLPLPYPHHSVTMPSPYTHHGTVTDPLPCRTVNSPWCHRNVACGADMVGATKMRVSEKMEAMKSKREELFPWDVYAEQVPPRFLSLQTVTYRERARSRGYLRGAE